MPEKSDPMASSTAGTRSASMSSREEERRAEAATFPELVKTTKLYSTRPTSSHAHTHTHTFTHTLSVVQLSHGRVNKSAA